MLNNVIIGQYIPGGSPLHRMDARVKIILTIAYIAVLFSVSAPAAYALFALFSAGLIIMSGINLKYFLKGLRPMLFIIIFTALINLFLTPGTAIFSVPVYKWQLSLTYEGVESAVKMFMRLLFLVTGTSLLTLTTTPLMLTDGIERLLKPLTVIRVPAHEIAMMMTIAIRFIPTLADETEKIQKAQTARGADFSSKNLIKRVKAMIPLLVPLFVSAFRRADELATAMDARCYRGGVNRTKMHEAHITAVDAWAAAVFVTGTAALVLLNSVNRL